MVRLLYARRRNNGPSKRMIAGTYARWGYELEDHSGCRTSRGSVKSAQSGESEGGGVGRGGRVDAFGEKNTPLSRKNTCRCCTPASSHVRSTSRGIYLHLKKPLLKT